MRILALLNTFFDWYAKSEFIESITENLINTLRENADKIKSISKPTNSDNANSIVQCFAFETQIDRCNSSFSFFIDIKIRYTQNSKLNKFCIQSDRITRNASSSLDIGKVSSAVCQKICICIEIYFISFHFIWRILYTVPLTHPFSLSLFSLFMSIFLHEKLTSARMACLISTSHFDTFFSFCH